MIMKEHSAVTCVSETWDGENNWQNIARLTSLSRSLQINLRINLDGTARDCRECWRYDIA